MVDKAFQGSSAVSKVVESCHAMLAFFFAMLEIQKELDGTVFQRLAIAALISVSKRAAAVSLTFLCLQSMAPSCCFQTKCLFQGRKLLNMK